MDLTAVKTNKKTSSGELEGVFLLSVFDEGFLFGSFVILHGFRHSTPKFEYDLSPFFGTWANLTPYQLCGRQAPVGVHTRRTPTTYTHDVHAFITKHEAQAHFPRWRG